MRILIVRLGAIGDVVHALPALSALRRSMSGAHIAWAVEQGAAAKLLQGCQGLDELIELDLRGWRKSLMNVETQTAIRKAMRSEERRVGEECRSRGAAEQEQRE